MTPSKLSSNRLGPWLLALGLYAPVLLLYLGHFTSSWTDANLSGTGFIQTDMAYYMANAREYFDREQFHLLYPSPFSSQPDSAPIYFQPQTIILGILWRLTRIDPGLLFCLFGFVSGVTCLRLVVTLWRDLVGLQSRGQLLGLALFVWGGGILALTGVVYSSLQQGSLTLSTPWVFDLHGGWWFLNFGRNLVYPTEAFYHLLFLGVVYCVLHQRYAWLAIVLAVLSWSHPFTGLQALSVVLAWLLVETYLGQRTAPRRTILVVSALMAVHVLYYLWFLNLDVEHRVIADAWRLDWSYTAASFLPAYALVAAMAAWQVRTPSHLQQFFAVPFHRFLAVWAAVSFVLANHEFAMAPVQPLHFTRGYVWTPLFLIGAKSLTNLLDRVITGRRTALKGLTLAAICLLFVFDNGAWFVAKTLRQQNAQDGFHLTAEAREVLDTLNRVGSNRTLVVSEDLDLGYLTVVYTPNRSWVSHWFNTPYRDLKVLALRSFFDGGATPLVWSELRLLVVAHAQNGALGLEGRLDYEKVLENESYSVYLRP